MKARAPPDATVTSNALIDAAATRTRTSPGPGFGSSTSTTDGPSSNDDSTNAFIADTSRFAPCEQPVQCYPHPALASASA